MIPLSWLLLLGGLLFTLGLLGVLLASNAVRILMGIELMLNAVNVILVSYAHYLGALLDGQIVAVFVMTVAAAEAAVGLAIIIGIARNHKTINIDRVNLLKW